MQIGNSFQLDPNETKVICLTILTLVLVWLITQGLLNPWFVLGVLARIISAFK